MKFFAIFRDSVREAVDTKIFYATLALSLLVIALIGSVTFRVVGVGERVDKLMGFKTLAFRLAPQQFPGMGYTTAEFTPTNGGKEPWEQEVRGSIRFTGPDKKALKDTLTQFQISPQQLRLELTAWLYWADQVTVTEVDDANGVQFVVETKGTKVKDRYGWPHEPALFFGLLPLPILQSSLGAQIEFIADKLIGSFGAGIAMLISSIVTAFFIPNMLRKGTIDLLLAKPIHRTTLLLYKFVGGLAFMLLNTTVIVVGIWLVLAMQTGLWLNGMLWCIPIFTFQFAIFYAVSTLVAVLMPTPIIAILAAVVSWALIAGIGWGNYFLNEKFGKLPTQDLDFLPRWVLPTVDWINFVTPRYKDLDWQASRLIQNSVSKSEAPKLDFGTSVKWEQSIGITTAFIGLMLGLACWRFATKDY